MCLAARASVWTARADLVDPVTEATVRCSDPDDQKFLDLGLSSGAFALFTRDKALLATAARAWAHGLRILLPDQASVLLLEDRVA
jgi:uncharacterized protein